MRRIDLTKALLTGAIGCLAFAAICAPVRADLIPSAPQKVVTSTPSDDETPANPPRPKIGFDIGYFIPMDAVVKNRFGTDWFTIGIGQGQIPSVADKGEIRLELDVLANTKGDNRAILIPIGLQYEIGLGAGSVAPYVGAGGEVIANYVQSSTDNVKGQIRAGVGGSVYAGVNIQHDVNLELRYRAMQKIAGYDFNGAEASAGLRF